MSLQKKNHILRTTTKKKKHTKKKTPKKIRKTLGHSGIPKYKIGERERDKGI